MQQQPLSQRTSIQINWARGGPSNPKPQTVISPVIRRMNRELSRQWSKQFDGNQCLQFLWPKNPEQKIEVFNYTRHNFGAKNLSTCANYALHQVAKSGERRQISIQGSPEKFLHGLISKVYQNTSRSHRNLQKTQKILSKTGFKLTKWITSDDKAKSQIQ